MTALQIWILAFRYIKSGLTFPDQKWHKVMIECINWLGIIIYSTTAVILYLISVLTFPGSLEVELWEAKERQIIKVTNIIFTGTYIVSTVVLLVGLILIYKSIAKMTKTFDDVQINRKAILIHGALEIFQCIVFLLLILSYEYVDLYNTVIVFQRLFSFLCQMMVCFVCSTIGNNKVLSDSA